MSKLIDPVGEALSDYEILRRIGARLGTEQAFTEGRAADEWLSFMYEGTRVQYARMGIELPAFATFRERGLVDLEPLGNGS